MVVSSASSRALQLASPPPPPRNVDFGEGIYGCFFLGGGGVRLDLCGHHCICA